MKHAADKMPNHRVNPSRPKEISEYAEACLLTLSSHGLGRKLSLGGAFGLAYYLEYRQTHDVNAWWETSASPEDRNQVVRFLTEALSRFGEVRTRAWGDVVSVELIREGRASFSFQVAQRSAQLELSRVAPWPTEMLLDSLPDLVAAKVAALVERGAPRDFRDIYELCKVGFVSPPSCWTLWRNRQQLSGGDSSPSRARLALETHLARIESQRPLGEIRDPSDRSSAAQLRTWFRKEFLSALQN